MDIRSPDYPGRGPVGKVDSILELPDHAQNGFFYPEEWIAVAASAFAVGFLVVPFLVQVTRAYLLLCAAVLAVEVGVGVLGFVYHTAANLRGRSASVFDNFVYGAPSLAPLLFPNLALLAFIGLWVLRRHLPTGTAEPSHDASAAAGAGEVLGEP